MPMGDALMSDGMLFYKALESLRNGLRDSLEEEWHEEYGEDWVQRVWEMVCLENPKEARREPNQYDPTFWLKAIRTPNIRLGVANASKVTESADKLIKARNTYYHHLDIERAGQRYRMPAPLRDMIKLLDLVGNKRERDQIRGWKDEFDTQAPAVAKSREGLVRPAKLWSDTTDSCDVTCHYFEASAPLRLKVYVAWRPDRSCVVGIRCKKDTDFSTRISSDRRNERDPDNISKLKGYTDNQFRNDFLRKELDITARREAEDSNSTFVASVKEHLLQGASDVSLELNALKRFDNQAFRDVLIAVTRIPLGQTRTYAEIAALVQEHKPDAHITDYSVGQALRRNPILFLIPCHRVVLSRDNQGQPDDYGKWGYGKRLKIELLDHERKMASAQAR